MARLTLILGVLAMVIYLLDGFRFMLNEWRNWRNKGKWLVVAGLLFLPSYSYAAELANDQFNRADGGLGANWTTVTGSDNPQIVQEHVQPEFVGGSTGSHAMYTGIAWPDDQYVTVRAVQSDTAGRQVDIVLRGLTASRTGYECIMLGPLGGSTARARIYKVTAGVSVLKAETSATLSVPSQDVLRCSASGGATTTIKLYLQDVELLSYDDTVSPFTSGSVGILVYTSSGNVANSQLDEFTGGSGSGAGMGYGAYSSPGGAAGCRITTTDATASIVNMAIHDATAGNVICLPSTTVTWKTPAPLTTTVVIAKGITLRGTTSCTGTPVTCADGTIINDGTLTTAGSDPLYVGGTGSRVTGISFKDPRSTLDAKPMLVMQCADCRLDHNSFTQTNSGGAPHGVLAYSTPTTTALIDHNYFKDLNGDTDMHGSTSGDTYPGDFSWRSTLTPGDGTGVYLEDNNYDHTAGVVLDGAFDTYTGTRFVFRYNTVTNTNSGGHGLDSGGFRSVLSAEIYRNTYQALGSAIYTWWNSRGGYHSVWQNTISASGGSYNDFMWLQNYRGDTVSCAVCSLPLCDGTYVADQNTSGQEGYACRDQVGRGPTTDYLNDWPVDTVSPTFSQPLFPSYSWGNDYRGVAPTIADVFVGSGDGSHTRVQTYHILNNRDFYMEVPSFNGTVGTGTGTSLPGTCTTGVAYFKTDEGSWNVSGNGDGSGLLYICTATNTWTLSYTPYTYPHPLQSAFDESVTAPSPVVIARVLRWMEVVLPIVGFGFHFRKYVLACCVATIACTSTMSLSAWTSSKVFVTQTTVKALESMNAVMRKS